MNVTIPRRQCRVFSTVSESDRQKNGDTNNQIWLVVWTSSSVWNLQTGRHSVYVHTTPVLLTETRGLLTRVTSNLYQVEMKTNTNDDEQEYTIVWSTMQYIQHRWTRVKESSQTVHRTHVMYQSTRSRYIPRIVVRRYIDDVDHQA